MAEIKRTVDYAPTKEEAIAKRDMYASKARKVLGISDWVIGYEDDPIRGPDGKHGFVIFARLPEQRKSPEEPPAETRSQSQTRTPRRRHLNRKRR